MQPLTNHVMKYLNTNNGSALENRISTVLIVAFLLRLGMTFIGSRILDVSASNLNYTDIDYNIFTDAAQLIVAGESPYERSTYRYPPLLALIMTPNVLLFPEWGKLLFSLADVGIVYLIYAVRMKLDRNQNQDSRNENQARICGCGRCEGVVVTCSSNSNFNNVSSNNSNSSNNSDSSSNKNIDNSSSNIIGNDFDSIYCTGISKTSSPKKSADNVNIDIGFNNYCSNISSYNSNNSISSNSNNNNSSSGKNVNDSNNNNNSNTTTTTSNKNDPKTPHIRAAWLWALNPLAINICTRGSADSLTNCMVLALLYYLIEKGGRKRNTIVCGALYGSLIHFRVYPVIYLIGIVNYLFSNFDCQKCVGVDSDYGSNDSKDSDYSGYNRRSSFGYNCTRNKSNYSSNSINNNNADKSPYSDSYYESNEDDNRNDDDKEEIDGKNNTSEKKEIRAYRNNILNYKKKIIKMCRNNTHRIRNILLFLISSFSTFTTLSFLSYIIYGAPYFEHAILYHLTRADHRHNFSPLFYGIYLTKSSQLSESLSYQMKTPLYCVTPLFSVNTENTEILGNRYSGFCDFFGSMGCAGLLLRIGPFLPQILILLVSSATLAPRNLPVWLVVQTFSFVAFNKVITAQYFTWFAFLILIIIPTSSFTFSTKKRIVKIDKIGKMEAEKVERSEKGEKIEKKTFKSLLMRTLKNSKKLKSTFFQRISFLLFLWVFSLTLWLYTAYLLEFKGENKFLELWFASMFFHIVNISIIVAVIFYFKESKEKVEKKGK